MANTREFKVLKELHPRKKKFADLILKGYSKVDAFFMAGYLSGKNPRDKEVRERAIHAASKLSREPAVNDYIRLNTPMVITDRGFIDENELVDHLKLIALGSTMVLKHDKKGEEFMEPPSFKEQVEAAKTLFNVVKMREGRPQAEENMILIGEDVKQLQKQLTQLKEIGVDED